MLLVAVAAVSLAACADGGDRPAGGSSDAAQPVDEPHAGNVGDAGLRDAGGVTSALLSSSSGDFLSGIEALTEGLAGDTSALEPWPAAPAPEGWEARAAPRIPLGTGMTVVTAIEGEIGDYESVKQVTGADDRSVTLAYSTRGRRDVGQEDVRTVRTVLRTDLDSARTYRMVFGAEDAPLYEGVTALGVSRAVLLDLDRSGTARLSVVTGGDMLGNLFSAFGGGDLMPLEGTIERLEPRPVGLPVLLNGERKWLPAVHAGGTLEGLVNAVRVEFWFLADPDNPLMLRAALGSTRIQVVRIDLPVAVDEAGGLETALGEDEGPVELFGLYFPFGSADILPESEPVLDEIAGLMRLHPEWRLRVEGHTDDVGTPAANLDLSRRRAQAVVDAVVERLGGGADRLTASGYGESQPIESNETLEGRARNRRVELIRY